MDSVVLAEHGVHDLFDKNRDVPRRINHFLKGISEEHLLIEQYVVESAPKFRQKL